MTAAESGRGEAPVDRAPGGRSRASGFQTAWATGLLALVALFAGMDRNVVAVLLAPIQRDLRVSDAAMGALTGSSFAIAYGLCVLPLARLADTTNRRNLVAATLAIWSAATAFCGLAGSYLQLLVARVFVAGSVSAEMPAAMSFLADRCTPGRRGRAVSVVIVGSGLGYAVGAYAAGVANDLYGWHAAMAIVGLPGIALAALILFTVREPPRGVHEAVAPALPGDNLFRSLQRCARIRTAQALGAGFVFLNIGYQGYLVWVPTFLIRAHHLSASKMGAVFGVVTVCGALSNLLAGYLSDQLAKGGARRRLYYCTITAMLSAPLLTVATLMVPLGPTILGLAAFAFVSGGLTTACTTVFLLISPANARGMMVAMMQLGATVIGGGVGPPLLGWVNDHLKTQFGDQSLRYALQLAPAAFVIAAILFLIASRTLERDAAEAAGMAT